MIDSAFFVAMPRNNFFRGIRRLVAAGGTAISLSFFNHNKFMESEKYLVCKSLGEAWLKYLSKTIREGQWVKDNDDMLLEIRNVMAEIKAIEFDPIIDTYADRDRIRKMEEKYFSCEIIPPYLISYGKLFFDHNGVNQIDFVVNKLLHKNETKSATISFHTPGESELSCLSLLDFKIRDGQLIMTAIYRSQNIFSSQPGNLLALRKIQEIVATRLNCLSGSVFILAISAHVYQKDLESAKTVLFKTNTH